MTTPGWFPDPDGTPGRLRWWDGHAWTPTVQDASTPTAAPPQPPASTPSNAMGKTATRTPSGWVVLGLLALILGVTLGILIKPFGGPTPLPSDTHPAVTDQSPNHEEGHPPQDDLCSSGVEDDRLRAGVLSVEAPPSPDWRLSDNYRHPEAYCSNVLERPYPEYGSSLLMAFQVPPSDNLDQVRKEITDWAIAELFMNPSVSRHTHSFERVDDQDIRRAGLTLSDQDGRYRDVNIFVAEDRERGVSVVLTMCVADTGNRCDETWSAEKSLRWER